MVRYTKHQLAWGEFCDVKINAPDVLRKQLPKSQRGLVSLSTVTDPYQAVEKKYDLTRKILTELATYRFPVSILTKSPLVLRDINVLKRFQREDCEVGFSIATLNEEVRRLFEPEAPSIKNRIDALKQLHQEGIRTWVFLAPVLPDLTNQTLFHLLNTIKDDVDNLLVDTLNIKCGNWRGISKVIVEKYPSLSQIWKDVLFSKENKKTYYQDLFQNIGEFCTTHGLEVQFC